MEKDSSGIDLLQREAVLPNEGQHSFTPPARVTVICIPAQGEGEAGGVEAWGSPPLMLAGHIPLRGAKGAV